MNSDTPPTEQRAKLNLLPEEEDRRILFLGKIPTLFCFLVSSTPMFKCLQLVI